MDNAARGEAVPCGAQTEAALKNALEKIGGIAVNGKTPGIIEIVFTR
ncbi:MAG: hypothetical protein LBH95_00770 [Oscillospiraceae bacterium]|jgi:hypothetical protein|nr:hypothetical protein [Oscillospiraceae bacterium]